VSDRFQEVVAERNAAEDKIRELEALVEEIVQDRHATEISLADAQREIERLREALEEMQKLAEHLYDGGRVNQQNGWDQRFGRPR
jgi:septal ring factor EnvC (AmiA/AmiB activator)